MRVGIAGAGFMASTHATEYAEMDLDVVAVASPSGPEEFVDEFGFEADSYTDVREMCLDAEIDFLDICTPTHTHRDLVQTAAETGVDVFLEKPIARTLDDAHEIVDIVNSSGIVCMVGHVVRFMPSHENARTLDVGEPGVTRARRMAPFPDWGSADWFSDRDKSGGIFVDLAIHDLDYLRWCWGDVERVFARRHRDEKCEHGFVTLRFENGAVGYVEASWAQPDSRPFTVELEFAGDDGLVEFSSTNEIPYLEWANGECSKESPIARNGYRRQLEHFVDCLENDTEPAVGPEEALASLRLALAAERSAELGESVALSEVIA
ncbi:Gfo/Idh/MocA family oxidoreductase [Halobacteria archaeon AArc-dxtr1]|nr:Gfo/Idh/MocA family oxidoreductase [Halobacteria archaeon AArc-dxtr1]